MAINPLQQPINYTAQMVDLGPSFRSAGEAFQQLGQTYNDQAKTEAAKVAKQQFASDLQTAQNTGTQAGWLEMVGKYPQFREAFGDVRKGVGEERVKNEFNQGFEISNALENNAPEVAIDRVKTIIQAKSNSGESTKIYDDVLKQLEAGNIKGAQNGVNFALIAIDPDRFEKGVKAKSTAAEAPAALRAKLADASKAETQARVALETATGDIATADAKRKYEEARAKNEEVKAQYAVKEAEDAIVKRLADLGLTKAQTNEFNVKTRNLDTTGKLLLLDYKAAEKGLPLPSKNAGTTTTVGNATEDERKAAGWLSQANNAYTNMLGAMYTSKGKRTGAESPNVFEAMGAGKWIQGEERQKFNQAASSLSEALLRAATGAGVNESEAKQKIEELTPTLFDTKGNTEQKLAAIPMYLQSLQSRAGRAAPPGYTIPTTPSGSSSVSGPVMPAVQTPPADLEALVKKYGG